MESIQRLAGRAREVFAEQGALPTIIKGLQKVRAFAAYPFAKRFYASRTFSFMGREIPYFVHHYNNTWRNERAVEIALVSELLATPPSESRFLEVGNVLNYYFELPHVAVDKFENAPNIVRKDILDFGSPKSFDLIVSISTLEHVGWDETPRDPEKVKRALTHMKSLLADGGRFFLTFPLGYNPPLDQLAFKNELPFREIRYLKRVSKDNQWREVSIQEVMGSEYGKPYPYANALFVGID